MNTEDKFYFGKPGQPERFGLEDACWEGYEPVGTKQKDGRTVPNCVPKDENEQPEEFAESLQAKWDGKQYRVLTPSGAAWYSDDGKRWTLKHGETVPSSEVRKYDIKLGTGFSRPGQPDKFDASSLNRGDFAEASTSPMLGKLLAAKVMPEGGWRAVETGGGALVISFEDADLASDFGRRVATKGYNATNPAQTIGRYWNVEVRMASENKNAVEDRFYFGKGRKERFADDVYLDIPNARLIAYDLQKVIGSMKPMGESRMDAAIVQALGQLQKISATLQQPKFVSISTLKAMMRQVDGLAKKFYGLYSKYWDEHAELKDERWALQRALPRPGKPFPLGSRESREYTRKTGELRDTEKNIGNLAVLAQEAWRIEKALAPIAKRYM